MDPVCHKETISRNINGRDAGFLHLQFSTVYWLKMLLFLVNFIIGWYLIDRVMGKCIRHLNVLYKSIAYSLFEYNKHVISYIHFDHPIWHFSSYVRLHLECIHELGVNSYVFNACKMNYDIKINGSIFVQRDNIAYISSVDKIQYLQFSDFTDLKYNYVWFISRFHDILYLLICCWNDLCVLWHVSSKKRMTCLLYSDKLYIYVEGVCA